MYFKSREAAGRLLASQITKRYSQEPCAIVALNDGGVVAGMQIAQKLHCVVMMLATAMIKLPREEKVLGGITADGTFAYSTMYAKPYIEELTAEYHNFIEQEKLHRINEMHRVSGEGDLIRRDLLEKCHIILVSDGLWDSFSLDLAFEFLKPIDYRSVIVATPLASIPAVDRMHVMADDIYCLNVIEDFFGTDHYYDVQDVPPHEKIIATIEQMVKSWEVSINLGEKSL